MRELVVHIGLPKTATTFLQFSIFDHLKGWRHVHRNHGPASARLCNSFRSVARAKESEVDRVAETMSTRLTDLDGVGPSTTRMIVSHEPISIGAIEMWNGGGVGPSRTARHLARALAQVQVDRPPRIIIGIRRQDQFLGARFAESCRTHYAYLSQRDFDDQVDHALSTDKLERSYSFLYYDRMHESFAKQFGKRNVLILPMELLRVHPRRAGRTLARFLGDPNVRTLIRRHGETTSHANALAIEPNVWNRRDGDGTIVLSDAASKALIEKFREHNQVLSEQIGVDLGGLGYY